MKTKSSSHSVNIIVLFLAFLVFASCSQNKNSESISIADVIDSEEMVIEKPIPNSQITDQLYVKTPKDLKIIKTATTRYKVADVQKATREIKMMALKYDAYISDLKYKNTLYEKQNKFTIKVPNSYFDVVMDSISKRAVFVEFENISTKDVTEEYVDIQTRLKTKMEVKKRYEAVLKKNAKTVEEILLTEEKLRLLQEEIEAAQGRLKYLNEKVAYSTIHIDLFEVVEYKEQPERYTKTFVDKAGNGFSFGWGIIETLILGLIHIWPLLIIVIFVVFLLKYYRNKKKRL